MDIPARSNNKDLALLQRVFVFLVVVCLVTVICSPVSAARDVKVALHELKPSLFTDENGRPAGIFVDLITDIAAKEDWNIIWVHGTLQENFNRLAAGDIDLMMAVVDTPEREKLYDFNHEQAVGSWTQVYVVPGSNINTMLDLDGKRVAVLKGDVNAIAFRDYAKKFSISPVYVERDTLDDVFKVTATGQADASVAFRVAGQEAARKNGLAETPIMFFPSSLGFAAPKGRNADLLAAIDRYLAAEKSDPSSYYSLTMQKWFGEKAGWVVPPYLWWILGIFASVACLFVIMSLLLRRQVQKKTAEIRQQNEELRAEVAGRKQAEADLIRKNEELRAAYEQLTATEVELRTRYDELGRSEKALIQARKKLSLLNTLAFQDIQSGIFSLSGFLQLAMGAGRLEEAQGILNKGERVLHTLSESLSFARKYQNLGIAQPRWQRVNYVLINAISHLDFSRIRRTVELDNLEIYADPLLEDVFVTLMENVLRHGAGATEVSIRYRENPDNVTIFIGDNGPGIPEDQKERIFSRDLPHQGGNSLFLAREILSITNITIAESGAPGAGSRFAITVPAGGYRFGASNKNPAFMG